MASSLHLSASSATSNLVEAHKSFLGLKLSSSSRSSLPRRVSCVPVRAAASVASKFTTLKPLGDRILVKIKSVEEKTSGGILLPTTAQNKPNGGEVVAIGDGRTFGDKKIPVGLQKGKNVVYSKYAGTEIDFNGVAHLLLKEDDVIGILDTDDIKDLQPSSDRVLIKVAEAEDKTAGGVLLTETSKEKPVTGTVTAAGPGHYVEDGTRKPLDLTVGNTVMYSKYAGSEFKSADGSLYVVLKASDVLAVLA